MNGDKRLENKLRFAKPKKGVKRKIDKTSGKIHFIEPTPENYDSPINNVLLGDMMGTGIIGGIDLDITTPL